MSSDMINDWVEKAKHSASDAHARPGKGVQVIKRVAPQQVRGNIIMELADKLYPWLVNMFDGVRDENGMLLQPARVRGIALNVAQDIVREKGLK